MTQFIIVATPVYITLFWAIVFLTGNIMRKRAKLALSVFMLTAATLYTCHAIYFLNLQEIYLTVDAIYLFTSLSVYPLYYWYVKLLTVEKHIEVYNLLHLVPALVLAVLLELFHIIATPEEQMQYYSEVLIENNWQWLTSSGNIAWLARIFFTSRIVFLIQVVYCLILGYKLANTHNKRIEDFYSNMENRRLVWVKLLNISFFVFSIASITFNILGRGIFLSNESSLIIPSVIFSSLLFLVGLQGNKQNDTIREMETESDSFMPNEALSAKSSALLKARLEELMIKDRVYLVSDLKITTLCKMLNTNRTYVSNLINEETGNNFNNYVNRFRIEHAKELMNQRGGSLLVMDFIAQESGFGSTSSFIRAFKSFTGITPGKYLQDKNFVEQHEQVAEKN